MKTEEKIRAKLSSVFSDATLRVKVQVSDTGSLNLSRAPVEFKTSQKRYIFCFFFFKRKFAKLLNL